MSPNNDTKTGNAHANAAGAYGSNAQQFTSDQRELEGHVLLKSAKMLQDLQNDWDSMTNDILEQTLKYNRQIWMLFYDAALENPEGDRPNDLRSNIINLANFIFKHELNIMADPKKEKLSSLININRDIAAGLMTKKQTDENNAKETLNTEHTSISDSA